MAVINENYMEMKDKKLESRNIPSKNSEIPIPNEQDNLITGTEEVHGKNRNEQKEYYDDELEQYSKMGVITKQPKPGWKEKLRDHAYVVVCLIFVLIITIVVLSVIVGVQQQKIQHYDDIERSNVSKVIGDTTSKTVTTSAAPPNVNLLSQYCNNYDTIDDEWRKIRNWMLPTDANSDYDNSALDGKNWFRFLEPAGTQLPEKSPPKKSFKGEQVCDTYAVAWIDGPHPNTTEAIVERKVCFSWFRKKCMGDPLTIHIVKCNDDNGKEFFIYQLKRPNPATGMSAYCAL